MIPIVAALFITLYLFLPSSIKASIVNQTFPGFPTRRFSPKAAVSEGERRGGRSRWVGELDLVRQLTLNFIVPPTGMLF